MIVDPGRRRDDGDLFTSSLYPRVRLLISLDRHDQLDRIQSQVCR